MGSTEFFHGAGRFLQNIEAGNYILWFSKEEAPKNRWFSFGNYAKIAGGFSVILHNEKNSKELEKKA